MIIKSLIILSIIFNSFGFSGMAKKMDDAVVRDQAGSKKIAQASDLSEIKLPDILPRAEVRMGAQKAEANARHYLLADADSGEIIAKYDENAHVPIASTTKIMTAVVALENYDLDDIATISDKASQQIGADAYLQPGEKITIGNLLNCMLIKSGNDSAYAVAEHMDKANETDVAEFVRKMNEKAKELGMNDTHYNDPAGLDTTGYSSAHDLFLVTKYALQKDEFRKIVIKSSEVVTNTDHTIYHELKNSNRLVAEYQYPGAIGVKTGYMPEAGHVLVGAAKRNNHTLVAVVINTYADTASASADEARRLLDWGFTNIIWK